MKKLIISLTFVLFSNFITAQQFIEKAVIEFEVNTNLKKMMSNDGWGEMIKENLSELKTSYYSYTFANNKSIFKFNRWSPKTKIPKNQKDDDEEESWYTDFESKTISNKKLIGGTSFVIADSISKIDWKITNENREIAGYNCRKAIGKLFDDVYIFAFYTDDIVISGGPCSINGLPGMIFGLTIPRLYTSYIATKVNFSVTNIDEIKPIDSKKRYNSKEYKTVITDISKDWFTYGNDKEENKRQKNIFLWNAFL